MEQAGKKVDIIVPIYNAYDHLIKCVDSILKYTNLHIHRLILLNDNSSDERIVPYLKRLEQLEGIYIKNNETNLGFSGNINQGIELSSNDVILLNSDTIVTKKWLEKIQSCAYRDDFIATVTPLSNAATIYSIPNFCEDNQLPNDMTVDQMAELVESSSLKLYPETPVAHGFCMYIKRKILDILGGFNSDIFKKGYGEENDFCYRAEELGYCHVMCDDTFVYHAGTASFSGKEKKQLIKEHKDYLFKHYPRQMHETENYCKDNLNHNIQDNIKFRMKLDRLVSNGKKNVLYQLQTDFRMDAENAIGGVQLHVKDLVESLKDKFNIIVVAREQKYINVRLYSGMEELKISFYIGDVANYMRVHDPKIEEYYYNIFAAFKVDLVHVHHTYGIGLDIYYVAEKLGVPIITTIHDYYCVCPKMNLVNYKGEVCKKKPRESQCRECLKYGTKIEPSINYICWWRKQYIDILKTSKIVIVPSKSTKNILTEYYPELKDKIETISHGVESLKRYDDFENKEVKKKIRVAFLGSVGNPIKGGNIIAELIKKGGNNIEWYIFGPMGHCELKFLNSSNYIKFGPYRRKEISKILKENKIDLVGILSICPETYCYTLSESILSGVPVITFDNGAVGERVKEYQCGWILNSKNADDILKRINQIKKEQGKYTEIKENLKKIKIKTISEMSNEYEEIYRKYIPVKLKRNKVNSQKLFEAFIGKEVGEENRRREEVEKKLQRIESSIAYKMSLKLTELQIPGKQNLMKILFKLYALKQK